MKYITTLILIVVGISGCSSEKEWTAFVYPDIENIPNADQTEYYIIGKFTSFESCQQSAIDQVRFNNEKYGKQGDYQCGSNCQHKEEFGSLLICEEIKK
ncbi:hypothetical protein [Sulfuricurvum sp.]|uniref:hypothetical protein n=1 Tax=Sulfuricurvum sp. TaxID=2025608 RepID=UPI00262FC879|nr:hypothetical protein [Sulfuricurvum sp.]MDD3597177.1 hypothetical protein [Sulfuricurvum sp.]